MVVIWFGALFGLASLAIRPALLERLVSAAGIDLLVPMAAAPLGTTARLLVALMMTLLGCVVGAIVGRGLAKPAAKTAGARRRPAPTAQVEDGPSEVALFGAAPSANTAEAEVDQSVRRRRQLAIIDTAETFDDQAPLPGSAQILSVAELPLKSFDEVDGIWLHSSDRAEPNAGETPADHDQDGILELAGEKLDTVEPSAPAPVILADEDVSEPAAGARGNRLFDSYVRRVNAGIGSNDSEIPAPGFVSVPDDLSEPATRHCEASVLATDEPVSGGPPAAEPDTEFATDAVYANTAERIATAPLDALSHVELLERLALTIARRRREAAQSSEAAATPAPAEPVWFSAPQSVAANGDMPAALRPHWMDGDQDDDDALPAIAPPRTITMAADRTGDQPARAAGEDAPPIEEIAMPQDPRVLAQGYSSLQGMTKLGVHQVFDRSGAADVPATGSPMPAARAFDAPQADEPLPDQTEQALRAALATLRRMSGAA